MPEYNEPVFVLYPRGYVGPVVEETPKASRGFQINLTNIHAVAQRLGKQKPDLPFNEEIERLYLAYANPSHYTQTMEFRERVLKAAFAAFGTKDFLMWYETQFRSPTYGEYHSQFIDDCMRFIVSGKRQMDTSVWMRMIDFSYDLHPPMVITERPYRTEVSKDFFESKEHLTLINVIHEWLQQEGGLEDLLISMKVFFGS